MIFINFDRFSPEQYFSLDWRGGVCLTKYILIALIVPHQNLKSNALWRVLDDMNLVS